MATHSTIPSISSIASLSPLPSLPSIGSSSDPFGPSATPQLPASSSLKSESAIGSRSISQHLQSSPATAAARMLGIDLSAFGTSHSIAALSALSTTSSGSSGRCAGESVLAGVAEVVDGAERPRDAPPVGDELTEELLSARTRQELERMLLRAERVIRARERELGLAASIGKELLQRNESLTRKHKRLLSLAHLSSAQAVSPTHIGKRSAATHTSPGSSIDSLGSLRSIMSARDASVDNTSFRAELFGLPDPGLGAELEEDGGQTPHPPDSGPSSQPPAETYRTPSHSLFYTPHTRNRTRTRTQSNAHPRTPSFHLLTSQNSALQQQLETLEQEAREQELEGRRRLRKLERELEGLKGELEDMRREREVELEMEEVRRREISRKAIHADESDKDEDRRKLGRRVPLSWRDSGLSTAPSEYSDHDTPTELHNELGDDQQPSTPRETEDRFNVRKHTMQTHPSISSLASSYHSVESTPARVSEQGESGRAPTPDLQQTTDDALASASSDAPQQRQRTASTLTTSELPLISQLLQKIKQLEQANADLLAQREGMEERLWTARRGVRDMELGIGSVVEELSRLGGEEFEGLDDLDGFAEPEGGENDDEGGIIGLGVTARLAGVLNPEIRSGRERSASAPSDFASPGMEEDPTVRLPLRQPYHPHYPPASPSPNPRRCVPKPTSPFKPASPVIPHIRSGRRKALPPAFIFPPSPRAFTAKSDYTPLTAPLAQSAKFTAPLRPSSVIERPLTAPLPPLKGPTSRAASDRSTPTLWHFPRSSSDEDEYSHMYGKDSMLHHDGRDDAIAEPTLFPTRMTPEVEQLEEGWKRLNEELKRIKPPSAKEGMRRCPTVAESSIRRTPSSLGDELARVQGGAAVLGTLGAGPERGTWRFTPLQGYDATAESEAEVEAALLSARIRDGEGTPMTPPQVDRLDIFEHLDSALAGPELHRRSSSTALDFGKLVRPGALTRAAASTMDLLLTAVEQRAAKLGTNAERKGITGWIDWFLAILLWLDALFRSRKQPQVDGRRTRTVSASTLETRTNPLPSSHPDSPDMREENRQLQVRHPFPVSDQRITKMVGDAWLTLLFMWTLGVFVLRVARSGPRGVLLAEEGGPRTAGTGQRQRL